jgi:hypothetical protein
MSPSPLDPLRDLFGTQLEDLTGGVVSGELPLMAEVVNRLIARKLATANAPVTAAVVEPLDADAFSVHLHLRGPLPQLVIDARIDQQPRLPDDPTIGVRWTVRGLGPLAMFAAPLIAKSKSLPPGLRLERDHLWVDVHELLRTQGLEDVVPWLTGVRVLTRERRFVIQFELRR